MSRLARTLENSLGVHRRNSTPKTPVSRRRHIGSRLKSPERQVAFAVDLLVEKHPGLASMALNGLAKHIAEAEYIGIGAFCSVYRRGDEVIKIIRHTASMGESQRRSHLETRREMTKDLEDHLGNLVAPQTLTIQEHILGEYQVVTAFQSYVDGTPFDLFETNTLKLNRDKIEALIVRQSSAENELKRLVLATFFEHDHSRLVPDLNGVDNFRLTGESETLTLIDAEPIAQREHQGVHDHILRQAEVLGQFVDAA